jgi:2-polyprenyl-6-methoxyphenol hydroxylase-like FAD-dependent oxidoreductase
VGELRKHDVVIVGGGIAGSAIAAALAPAGVDVLVIERQVEYRDRVRGEYLQPWGAAEARRLGVEQTLLDAGGGYTTRLATYGEDVDVELAASVAVPLDMLIPGVPGGLNVGHPQASEALSSLAAERGATSLRGIGAVEVEGTGGSPSVRYELDGDVEDVQCRLVIGADGRQSTVRRNVGVGLEQADSKAVLGGMLVRADFPDGTSILGVEGDRHFLIFPRPNGFVRIYLACDPGPRTAGADRAQHMLDAYALESVPGSDRLANAEPAGPCSYYVGSDSWTTSPAPNGVVLAGDAAGWSDPVIGEGLSIALRDARSVAETMLASDDWSTTAFEPYVEERTERMRRLRIAAHVATEMRCTFTPEARLRRAAFRERMMGDPMILDLMLSTLAGPEIAPAECFTEANVEHVLAY